MPVLLLVVDGLSHAAAVPLEADLRDHGWTPLGPSGDPLPPVVAALPTVTTVSRASLLSGRLTTGGPDVEREGFATAPELVEAAGGQTPVLFHKADLRTTDGEIAPTVRDVVADPDQRIVGVVVNAVDDHLDKGGQLRLADGLQGVPVLTPVLRAAAEARRVVVVTSDHGHILGSRQRVVAARGGGERYRVDDTPPASDEVEVSGGRVLCGDHRAVVAAEETVRYIPTAKLGYHGGVTPAEALCPLLVVVYGDSRPAGWEPLAPRAPAWWDPDLAPVSVDLGEPAAVTSPPPATARRAAAEAQLSLLEPEPAPAEPPRVGGPVWLSALLASPRLATQRRLAGRAQLDDRDLGQLVRVLVASGGTASGAALARTLDLPSSRLRGKLEGARGLLNVDGYPVLRIESDGTARLDVRLLAAQFELPALGDGADG